MDKVNQRQILRIRFGCLGLIAALATAIWANFPYLSAEHRRWDLWQLTGLWFSDIAALVWFARFAFVHAIQGRPLLTVPLKEGRRQFKWTAAAISSALLIDLAFTLYLMGSEKIDYARAQSAVAQVISVKVHKRELATEYELECSFRDKSGTPHQAHFRVHADKHEMPGTLPPETAGVIRNGGHGKIGIRYDQTHPERAWIDGLGWHDENGIYWISIGNICLQGATSLLFLLLLTKFSTTGAWPWWSDIYKILPLTAETFCMFAMGIIDRLMDSLS
jgi:hypothetical protein